MIALDAAVAPVLTGVLVAGVVALVLPVRSRLPTDDAARAAGRSALGRPVVVLGLVVVPILLGVRGSTLVVAVVGVCAVAGGAHLLRRRRAAGEAERAALRATEFCEALAAELAAGAAPHPALVAVAGEFSELGGLAGAGRFAADVPATLRELADRPGLGDLRLVAAAWQVSHRSGSGLADALERVGATLRARRRTARLVSAELAAAHATARIMAALPVVFVLAGSGLGADPLGFLTGSGAGAVCLGLGLLLTWAGLAWLQRIADRVGTP